MGLLELMTSATASVTYEDHLPLWGSLHCRAAGVAVAVADFAQFMARAGRLQPLAEAWEVEN